MVLRIKPEKKEEKERVSLALLRATLRLAAAHGFASLGLREVARAADIAPTSFYRHFADMEQLGLALVEDLVNQFVGGWVERARAAPRGAIESIAQEALSGAVGDPELMRFVLAERMGAIASFRAALGRELRVLSSVLDQAFAAELAIDGKPVPANVGEAAAVLLLEACGLALDGEPEQLPVLHERVVDQIRTLLRGAATTGR